MILRIMVTIIPIAIAFASYYIQNNKFIVDEKFYDQMMLEIKERKEKKLG